MSGITHSSSLIGETTWTTLLIKCKITRHKVYDVKLIKLLAFVTLDTFRFLAFALVIVVRRLAEISELPSAVISFGFSGKRKSCCWDLDSEEDEGLNFPPCALSLCLALLNLHLDFVIAG
ncbi:hypothetical protein Bca4012_018585 [Brassica carinata]